MKCNTGCASYLAAVNIWNVCQIKPTVHFYTVTHAIVFPPPPGRYSKYHLCSENFDRPVSDMSEGQCDPFQLHNDIMWYKPFFCLFKTLKGEYVLPLYCKNRTQKSLGWGQSSHQKKKKKINRNCESFWKCENV